MRTRFVRFAHTTLPPILLWLTYFECNFKMFTEQCVPTYKVFYIYVSVWTDAYVYNFFLLVEARRMHRIYLSVTESEREKEREMWKWCAKLSSHAPAIATADRLSTHLVPLNAQIIETNNIEINYWNKIHFVWCACDRFFLPEPLFSSLLLKRQQVSIVYFSIQWILNNE